MDDVAVVTVYLKGQFPAGFQRLSDATRERLESFRGVAGSKIAVSYTHLDVYKRQGNKRRRYEAQHAQGLHLPRYF